MNHISVISFQSMIRGGAKNVISIEKNLNDINVFPVPDGDTGTNLAFLMNMILLRQHGEYATHSFEQLKMACLEGSRGNSGMIFSQFIIAMCDFIADKTHLTKEQFAEMCEHSFTKTYKAVHQPAEGTILTVMRDWVTSLNYYKQKVNSVSDLLISSLRDAFHSLEKTRFLREECRKKNVVDAGAKGFCYFIQGFIEGLSQKTDVKQTMQFTYTSNVVDDELIGFHHDLTKEHFRFCTEFIVETSMDQQKLKDELSEYGQSLVFIHSNSLCKFHIHTDAPEQIAHLLQQYGSIRFQKIEDMQKQQQMIVNRKSSVAIVIDSACDLPQAFIDEHDVYMLPLSIGIDESYYLDKLTLTSDQLYKHMENDDIKVTTSLPSREQITRLYKQLLSHYKHIVSIHVSSQLSGTYSACNQIAIEINKDKIIVIDSKTLSGAYGLVVKQIATYMKLHDLAHRDDIIRFILSQTAKSKIFVTVPTLTSMVASGRVSKTIGILADSLSLKPIVTIDEQGKSKIVSPTVFKRSNLPQLLKLVEHHHKKSPIKEYVILYTDDTAEINEIEQQMVKLTSRNASYITTVSSVIGKYAGKGAYSIALI